ncbi:hypothetical protein WICMUC_002626 [Wickerhamomyces mucosus]|uniref:Uncharacterized protein n=1 Tax=Wickerhamomyces mucosus TaxID=1378264 RepID=A0A9P8PQ11_9ASCO|nr:hypothetical protein WICMUC_002626 [Wickerhamomyces mucosus]
MSMFKTLQSNPGIITFYKSSIASKNHDLLHLLKLNQHPKTQDLSTTVQSFWSRLTKGDESKKSSGIRYDLEEIEDGRLPTYDQLKLILSYSNLNNDSIIKQTFPKFQKINGIYLLPDENKLDDYKDWFNPPLIVDWDKSIIAKDLEGLKKLLEPYQQ